VIGHADAGAVESRFSSVITCMVDVESEGDGTVTVDVTSTSDVMVKVTEVG